MDTGTRLELLERLAAAVEAVRVNHPVRVGVDGPPAAGKTTLADALAEVLRSKGRPVIRASIEEFLLPRAQRYRRGEYSAEACYQDSFDFEALNGVLLDPLGPGGDRQFQTAVYDKATDSALPRSLAAASADAVLLFDGVFLLRPELAGRWDLSILVTASFEETLARALTRDLAVYGSTSKVEQRFRERYGPSQRHYFEVVRPAEQADFVVRNDRPQRPTWQARTP